VDYETSRLQMVARQLQARGISDRRVLRAMADVPRERFLPATERDRSYEDEALPIGGGQTMSQPWIVAFMAQALELSGGERVLEVGAGSGYAAAVLGRVAREVVTIERRPELATRARAILAELGYDNIDVRQGDGSLGVPERAPFDAIAVTAAAPAAPPTLVSQLAEGGRLVIPLGDGGHDVLTRLRKRGARTEPEPLVDCRFVPLVGQEGYAPSAGRER
jgi:protein-L-isoaspartate(D-aspartate) O-methyltransferase